MGCLVQHFGDPPPLLSYNSPSSTALPVPHLLFTSRTAQRCLLCPQQTTIDTLSRFKWTHGPATMKQQVMEMGMEMGIGRCYGAGHVGHGRHGRPPAPPCSGPGYQVLLAQVCKAGAAALSAWLGHARPAPEELPPPRAVTAAPHSAATTGYAAV